MTWNVLVAICRVRLGLPLLVALSITLLNASPAKAGTTITQSTCPVVIAQSGEYALGTDVGPCLPGVDGIDITASNVTLHLNGHTINGAASDCNHSNGIHVLGTPLLPLSLVRVLGSGTISNFAIGLQADNSAGSFVKFTTVTAKCSFFSFGFVIQATSSMWKLDSNVVREPGISSLGIFLNGAADNDLVHNDVNDTMELLNSSNNTVVNNTASDNFGGITLFGTSTNNNIDANTTDNNSAGNGIWLGTGATGNNISGNKSFNNSTFDMEDDNANCDNNKWTGNHFNTANQSCIH
jgi:parallel beta-helix repeat protein